MAEITNEPALDYTVGSFTIKITLDHDDQGAEYTKVKLFSMGEPIGQELCLQTSDMKIVLEAMTEYFAGTSL